MSIDDIDLRKTEVLMGNVFPLRGKVAAAPNPHPNGSRESQSCKVECGRDGQGSLGITTDIGQIAKWWGGKYAGSNIGARVPGPMFVLNIDPRNDGLESLAAVEARFGRLPQKLTTFSGRGNGWRRPNCLRRRVSISRDKAQRANSTEPSDSKTGAA